jgi:hypothetical protein
VRPALLALALLLTPAPADAARCASGKIWRPSLGVCQSKAAAYRAGFRPVKRVKVVKHKPRPRPVLRVTYRDHVWSWVEHNRAELIREYGR